MINLDNAQFRKESTDYLNYPYQLEDYDILTPKLNKITEWEKFKETLPEYIRNTMPNHTPTIKGIHLKTAIARIVRYENLRQFTTRIMFYHTKVNNMGYTEDKPTTQENQQQQTTNIQENPRYTPKIEETDPTEATDIEAAQEENKEKNSRKTPKAKDIWKENTQIHTPLNHMNPLRMRNV